MQQPYSILPKRTGVRTHDKLGSTEGMIAPQSQLNARKPSAEGMITGVLPGHGGDVYLVQHFDDQSIAPYCYTEVELSEDGEPTAVSIRPPLFDPEHQPA